MEKCIQSMEGDLLVVPDIVFLSMTKRVVYITTNLFLWRSRMDGLSLSFSLAFSLSPRLSLYLFPSLADPSPLLPRACRVRVYATSPHLPLPLSPFPCLSCPLWWLRACIIVCNAAVLS